MEHGTIYAQGEAATQNDLATGTLWTRITSFTNQGPFNKIHPRAGGDTLEVLKDAIYYVFSNISFVGSESTQTEFAILKNNVATSIQAAFSMGVSGTYNTIGLYGDLSCVAGDDLSLGVQSEITGTWITVKDSVLGAFRLGNQE